MTKGSISFNCRNSMTELECVTQKLEAYCSDFGLPRKAVFQLKFAIEEIFVNIISYGYEDEDTHWIKFTLSCDNGILTIRIEDDAAPFNPLEADTPDVECPIEERQVGGLGLHLTKHLMSDIVYQRCGSRNVLTMKKQIGGA